MGSDHAARHGSSGKFAGCAAIWPEAARMQTVSRDDPRPMPTRRNLFTGPGGGGHRKLAIGLLNAPASPSFRVFFNQEKEMIDAKERIELLRSSLFDWCNERSKDGYTDLELIDMLMTVATNAAAKTEGVKTAHDALVDYARKLLASETPPRALN